MLETGQPEMQEAALAVMQHFLLRYGRLLASESFY